jgi:hypothetical protein
MRCFDGADGVTRMKWLAEVGSEEEIKEIQIPKAYEKSGRARVPFVNDYDTYKYSSVLLARV